MSRLFSPVALGPLELPNRIVVSPMCQYSAQDGCATDWHAIHLGTLALSGAALVFIEATAVSPAARITPGCLGLWGEAQLKALERVLAQVGRIAPARIGIQLAHAGRKGSSAVPWQGGALIPPEQGGWHPEAPSAIPHDAAEPAPLALDEAGLRRVRDDFVAAARRAASLGLAAIELHCAHGYLLHEFLSPVSNQRTDRYGGSLDHRMRFPLEIFEAVRAAVPASIPVGVRVSATDWLESEPGPSWRLEDSIAFTERLKALGCAWIDVSSGGISPRQRISVGPGYQAPFARAIRAATGLTTMAVGMITEPAQAETLIQDGSADLVALARAMLYDPRWGWHAAAALGGTVPGPQQYWRSLPRAAGRIFGDTPIGMR